MIITFSVFVLSLPACGELITSPVLLRELIFWCSVPLNSVSLIEHLVPLKICSTLNYAVSCLAERSSSNKVQQKVSVDILLIYYYIPSQHF